MREWFSVEAAAKGKGGGEILIYGPIGTSFSDPEAVGARKFVEALNALASAGPGDIYIKIHSPGGDVGDGMAIYNAIQAVRERVVCTIEGVAYSMASVIALAGRETQMYSTAQFMVHNPVGWARGQEKDLEAALGALRAAKSVLVTAYTDKTGKTQDEILAVMEATTWMTAQEAKDFGFVDVILTGQKQQIAACFDVTAWESHYRDGTPLPDSIEAQAVPAETKQPMGSTEATEIKPMKLNEIKAACPGATAEFVMAQFELCEANENRTVAEVATAFAVEQTKALEAERAALAAALAEAKKAPAVVPGVPAIVAGGATEDEDSDPLTEWESTIAAKVKRGMTNAAAIRDTVTKSPDLHKNYLRAYNAQFGRVI